MAKIKKIYIDDIANLTRAMLERASKKHKSINAYCIFVEGDHYHVLIPEYESDKERLKQTTRLMNILISRTEICNAFAQFVVPPAKYLERQKKKNSSSSAPLDKAE